MKAKKLIALLTLSCLLFTVTSCGGNAADPADTAQTEEATEEPAAEEEQEPPAGAEEPAEEEPGAEEPAEEEPAAEEPAEGEPAAEEPAAEEATEEPADASADPATADPEIAMDNFVKKLQAGNYVVAPELYTKTSVYSPDQVVFSNEGGSSYAFVSKDGEAFELEFDGDEFYDVAFVADQNAIDAVTYVLPNWWVTISEDNMWNLFYNNIDNPLEFTSHDENVKTTLLGLAGYGEMALPLMEEVHMLLDAEDPTSVHFTAHIEQPEMAMIHYDDLDLTLDFGIAESDPRVEAWLSDPILPETRQGWTDRDIAELDLVFMRDYGKIAVPFPTFASYALNFDDNAYMDSSEVFITDAHGTEEDVENYKAVLLENGYQEVTETLEDGSAETVYRLLLREETKAYAELHPYYDNGFALHGGMYFDLPKYEGLDQINEGLVGDDFPALPETDLFNGWTATDSAASRTEGWAYFFKYRMYMPMLLEYQDAEAAKAYLEAYGSQLEAKGYTASYTPYGATYSSPNDFKTVRYSFNEDENNLTLEFKDEISLTPDEANELIAQHGIPAANLHGDIGARDHTMYYHIISSFRGLHLAVYQPFDTVADAEAYLDEYAARLDEEGYMYTNPQNVGSYRQFVYWNEELKKYVGFDLNPEADGGATVMLELVSIEPEEDGILEGALSMS